MSPEYALSGVVSVKTDVFSFGVLLLEIVSGKKNYSSYDSQRPLNLIGLVRFQPQQHDYMCTRGSNIIPHTKC